jgi:hypothetical protein
MRKGVQRMEATAISHIAICTRDMEKSLAFYRDILGMQVLSEAVWKQSLYKIRSYVICRARLRMDLLDNRSFVMLLEISKRLIY